VPTTDLAFEPYCADLGPEKVLYVHEPHSGLRAVVVVDILPRLGLFLTMAVEGDQPA
jgi:hypothetical protein